MAGPAQQGSHDQDPHPGAGSSHPGADLRDLVPLIQGTADSVRRIRAIVEQDSAVVGADELRYVSPLGQGGFGVVFKCRYTPAPGNMRASLEKLTGRPAADGSFTVAVKKLKGAAETRLGMEAAHAAANGTPGEDLAAKAAREHAEAVAEFAHEVLMLKKLAHPNVIGYVGCAVFQGARAPGGADGDDEDGDEQLALVLEYAQYGSLKDMIARSSRGLAHAYQLAEGLQWCHDIARGMDYLHHCTPPIMHRDLKPGNVMLCAVDGRRVAKVADFGLAALCLERRKIVARQATIALSRAGDGQRSRVYKQFNTTGGVGSLHYMAPENYRGEPYGDHVDQYSFAIILYEVLLRQRAYAGEYLTEVQIADAAAGAKQLRPALPKKWPTEVKELLARCWHPSPAERPSFKPIAAQIKELLASPSADRVLKALAAGGKMGVLEKLGLRSVGQ